MQCNACRVDTFPCRYWKSGKHHLLTKCAPSTAFASNTAIPTHSAWSSLLLEETRKKYSKCWCQILVSSTATSWGGCRCKGPYTVSPCSLVTLALTYCWFCHAPCSCFSVRTLNPTWLCACQPVCDLRDTAGDCSCCCGLEFRGPRRRPAPFIPMAT